MHGMFESKFQEKCSHIKHLIRCLIVDKERKRSIRGEGIPKADHLTKEGVLIQVGM